MPEYQAPQNSVMDWAKDQSVMDPLYETLMKRAVEGAGNMMGAGDPEGDISNLFNPTGMPIAGLVAKIPFDQITKRNFELIQSMRKRGLPEEMIKAAEHGVERYPRVSAHVQTVTPEMPEHWKNRAFGVNIPSKTEPGLSSIAMDPELLAKRGRRGDLGRDITENYGHELTHTAQRLFLGEDEFAKRYNLGEIWAGGRNPLETSAHRNANKFANRMLDQNLEQFKQPVETMPDLLPREIGPIDRLMKWFGY